MKSLPVAVWALVTCVFVAIGCGPVDEEARQRQARAMLESMRRSVDLNGPLVPDVVAGDPMPETLGFDFQGKSIDLAAHSGNVILLSFWGGG